MVASEEVRAWMMRIPGLRAFANRKANALFRITGGFIFTQVLNTCVKMNIFQALMEGPKTSADLADGSRLGLERMQLLLRQAERLEFIVEIEPGLWMLNDAGAVVASDPGIQAMILHHDIFYRDLEQPDQLLAAPETETRLKSYWAYVRHTHLDEIDTETAADYSSLMHHSQAMLADCVLAAYDFGWHRSLLDIGGGDGSFLAHCAKKHPDLNLHLFDLPVVADLARDNLERRGLSGRSTVHGGDFTADRIPDETECVSLVRILCDHDDDRVRQILSNLHRSLKPGTRLVIAEAMAGPSEGARLAAVYFSMYFLAMGSGRCRSDTEIRLLLTEAGFRRPKTIKTTNPLLATLVTAER
nr:acetylserotonin O-methyltransferase [Roseibium denhamense]